MSVFNWQNKPSELGAELRRHQQRVTNGQRGNNGGGKPICLPGSAPYLRPPGTGADWDMVAPVKARSVYAR